MSRAQFVKDLQLEAHGGDVRLFVSRLEQGIRCRHPVAGIHRRGSMVSFGLLRHGLTLHRHGGVSLVGLPSSGGTSILWGSVNERVRRLGKDHRAIHLGPVGVYIGRDF